MNSCDQGKSPSGLPEGSTEKTSTINLAWVPQRNFLASPPTKPTILPSTDSNSNGKALLGHDHFERNNNKQTKGSRKMKKTAADVVSRPNQLKKRLSVSNNNKNKDGNASSASTGKKEKRNLDLVVGEGVSFDFSGVPTPICSCTGVSRQCYKWGAGGWQSSCCTTTISEYPLPMSTSRPGSRLAGRKMSNGAYGKLLQRLAIEGCDLSNAIDLKNHWAKHGTNKFVTIR